MLSEDTSSVKRRTTQSDVARAAGVARSSVATAFGKDSDGLKPETRERIFREAERLKYRPNHFARILLSGRSGLIGVISADSVSEVITRKLRKVVGAVEERGYQAVVHYSSSSGDGGRILCETMLDLQVEAVVCLNLGEFFADESLDILREAGVPLITFDGIVREKCPDFRSDSKEGFRLATRHALESGRTRPLLLARWTSRHRDWKHSLNTLAAIDGFREAVAEASLGEGAAEELIYDAVERDLISDPFAVGRIGMEAILRRETWPDVVICYNDACAVAALHVCRRAGVAVPETIALIGRDNEMLGEYCGVTLTTVAHNTEEQIGAGMNYLFKRIENDAGASKVPAVRRWIEPRLIVRESCGSLKQPRDVGGGAAMPTSD